MFCFQYSTFAQSRKDYLTAVAAASGKPLKNGAFPARNGIPEARIIGRFEISAAISGATAS